MNTQISLYKEESSDPKWNAQRNLAGRTHYVDDDTLRFHKSRVLSTHITDNGLLFALVESCAMDSRGSKRGFRGVIFDVFGTVLSRHSLEDARATRKAAESDMWAALNAIDAKAHTLTALAEHQKHANEEISRFMAVVSHLEQKKAA